MARRCLYVSYGQCMGCIPKSSPALLRSASKSICHLRRHCPFQARCAHMLWGVLLGLFAPLFKFYVTLKVSNTILIEIHAPPTVRAVQNALRSIYALFLSLDCSIRLTLNHSIRMHINSRQVMVLPHESMVISLSARTCAALYMMDVGHTEPVHGSQHPQSKHII